MEIEAKIVLQGKGDYDKAIDLYKPGGYKTDVLENYFFDGPNGELSQNGIMLRLRIKTNDAEINIKAHTEVEKGATCRFADTVKLPVDNARAALKDPSLLLPLVPSVQTHVQSLKYLGGFKTNRMTGSASFSGTQVSLKLDEVMYQFGTHYELELDCGSLPVTDLYPEVMRGLAANGISGAMGTQNKFQTFIAGCKASHVEPSSMGL